MTHHPTDPSARPTQLHGLPRVIHQLKQKLMAISTTAEDLESRLEEGIDCPPEEARQMMAEILTSVAQMNEILDQVQDADNGAAPR